MTSSRQWGPVSRIALMSAAAIAVIALAIGVTIWRYETAVSGWRSADANRSEAQKAGALIGLIWHERTVMTEYLIGHRPIELRELAEERADFARVAPHLTPGTASGRQAQARAVAAHDALYRQFRRISGIAGGKRESALMSADKLDGPSAAAVNATIAVGHAEARDAAAPAVSAE